MKECPKCEVCFPDEVETCPTDSVQTKLSLPGTQLLADRYLLESRLGRGAMGQVYLARDKKFDTRKVAVKTVRPDILSSEDLQEGEAKETEVWSRLRLAFEFCRSPSARFRFFARRRFCSGYTEAGNDQ